MTLSLSLSLTHTHTHTHRDTHTQNVLLYTAQNSAFEQSIANTSTNNKTYLQSLIQKHQIFRAKSEFTLFFFFWNSICAHPYKKLLQFFRSNTTVFVTCRKMQFFGHEKTAILQYYCRKKMSEVLLKYKCSITAPILKY